MFVKQIQKYLNYLNVSAATGRPGLIKELCHADSIIVDLTKAGDHWGQR